MGFSNFQQLSVSEGAKRTIMTELQVERGDVPNVLKQLNHLATKTATEGELTYYRTQLLNSTIVVRGDVIIDYIPDRTEDANGVSDPTVEDNSDSAGELEPESEIDPLSAIREQIAESDRKHDEHINHMVAQHLMSPHKELLLEYAQLLEHVATHKNATVKNIAALSRLRELNVQLSELFTKIENEMR